jgi:hypothetical protein
MSLVACFAEPAPSIRRQRCTITRSCFRDDGVPTLVNFVTCTGVHRRASWHRAQVESGHPSLIPVSKNQTGNPLRARPACGTVRFVRSHTRGCTKDVRNTGTDVPRESSGSSALRYLLSSLSCIGIGHQVLFSFEQRPTTPLV